MLYAILNIKKDTCWNRCLSVRIVSIPKVDAPKYAFSLMSTALPVCRQVRHFYFFLLFLLSRKWTKYIDRDDEILVKQADFKLDSGEKCTAYIVTSFDATGQEIRSRERFPAKGMEQDKINAYMTALYRSISDEDIRDYQIGTLITVGTFGVGTVVAFLLIIGFIYLLSRPYKESNTAT